MVDPLCQDLQHIDSFLFKIPFWWGSNTSGYLKLKGANYHLCLKPNSICCIFPWIGHSIWWRIFRQGTGRNKMWRTREETVRMFTWTSERCHLSRERINCRGHMYWLWVPTLFTSMRKAANHLKGAATIDTNTRSCPLSFKNNVILTIKMWFSCTPFQLKCEYSNVHTIGSVLTTPRNHNIRLLFR